MRIASRTFNVLQSYARNPGHRHNTTFRRRFSGTQTCPSNHATQTVSVPCGSNGSVDLILHLHSSASGLPPPIILYLPPGPLSQNHEAQTPVASTLASRASATVVQVNYRLSRSHRYPTPVHDILFGWDWVLENLVARRSDSSPGFNDYLHARLGVCGELVGGGLAAMLALTECHAKGHSIAAAALNNAVLDWTLPESLVKDAAISVRSSPEKGRAASTTTVLDNAASLKPLLDARRSLFKKTEDWFDPFASPALFFRSAGLVVPKEDLLGMLDEFTELSQLNQQDFLREQMRLAALSRSVDEHTEQEHDGELDPSKKSRKAFRRYPKVGSGLALPNFHLTTDASGPYLSQAEDFVSSVRRGMVHLDQPKHRDLATSLLEAEERVLHETRPTTNRYWHSGWDEELSRVARWFKDVL